MTRGASFDSIEILLYMSIFFFSMIGFEIILEEAMNEFKGVDTFASISTLFQFLLCFLLPLIVSHGKVINSFPRERKEFFQYIQLSVIVFGATVQATRSLKYVRYPTKVVFKSAKLIPTMIVSTLMNKNKNYIWMDYFSACLLCFGTAGYTYGSGLKSSSSDHQVSSDNYFGIILLSGSILCDSIGVNFQQKLMSSSNSNSPENDKLPVLNNDVLPDKSHEGISAMGLMFNVNSIGFSIEFIYFLFSGSISKTIPICRQQPRLIVFFLLLGLSLAVAVLAYTKLIQKSGSVTAVTVATLRKAFTVILSYVFFPKPILRVHIFSGFLVIAGLSLNGKLVKLFAALLYFNSLMCTKGLLKSEKRVFVISSEIMNKKKMISCASTTV